MSAKESPVCENSQFLETLEPRLLLSGNPNLWPLNLPDDDVAALPPLQPTVVTAGGQRLQLSYFDNTLENQITVTYNPSTDTLVSNKPGWWIINYPLDEIQGLPNINDPCGMTDQQIKDTVAADLFGPGTTACASAELVHPDSR